MQVRENGAVARMVGSPWTVSGLWLQSDKVQADDGDWVDDGGADWEVDVIGQEISGVRWKVR